MILILGALLGFISVVFGAYAQHGLHGSISTQDFTFIMTAVNYNQIYAVVISVIGLILLNGGKLANSFMLKLSGLLFIIGVILFSFSIYISISFNIPKLLIFTPTGGTIIILAWLPLAVLAIVNLFRK